MLKLLSSFTFGDMAVNYILNDHERAVVILLPASDECDLFTEKNKDAYNYSSLAHIHLSQNNEGIYSNCLKLSETLDNLKFKEQKIEETDDFIKIITTEEAPEGYGINHYLLWHRNELGFEISTEFYNNSSKTQTLEYITSASLDGLSPYLDSDGGKQIVFHHFKAGWSMEGLHKAETLTELGLEKAWNIAGENLKFGTVGSRPVRDHHPYCAVEDTASNTIWGMSLAHNASWQMELTRTNTNLGISCGIADRTTGLWCKNVKSGKSFISPKAYVTVAKGSIAEASNRILSLRHRILDKSGKDANMEIAYNEWATTWGNPTEEFLLKLADILKRGRTKYLVVDDGWFKRDQGIGDWIYNEKSFPNGMKHYTDEIRKRGLIPGIWMEFECATEGSEHFKPEYDNMKLTKDGHVIVGKVINGRRESFFDFRKPEVIDYLDERVIGFLRDNGFGYIKVDYNASTGAAIDGDEAPGENLRNHMEVVRNYFVKMGKEVPGLIIENCASGGCRLEQSMMEISQLSSGSDAHEGYEGPVVAANLHYIAPPRQNSVWCTLKPEYDKAHFSHIIAGGFLGRLCWSGDFPNLSEQQLSYVFAAEDFYAEVADIIKKGNSYIHRTDKCSFSDPTGTQAVIRFAEDGNKALVVAHSMKDAKRLEIDLPEGYKIAKSLYDSWAKIENGKIILDPNTDFEGNVYLLTK